MKPFYISQQYAFNLLCQLTLSVYCLFFTQQTYVLLPTDSQKTMTLNWGNNNNTCNQYASSPKMIVW